MGMRDRSWGLDLEEDGMLSTCGVCNDECKPQYSRKYAHIH